MNYKKNQNDNKIGKEINKTKTYKDNKDSNSFIDHCNIFEFSSLSFKSEEEEQNNIEDRKNKRNDIIDNSLKSNIKINHNIKFYDQNYFQDLTDKLYNFDEHLHKKKKIQRKNISLRNITRLKEILFPNNNKKTSISKKERAKKKKKKSLFNVKVNKKKVEEERLNIKNLRQSMPSKTNLAENKNKRKESNLGSFLKLKPKNKYPHKESYFDSIYKNSVYSRVYSIVKNNNENKDPSIRTIKTNKKNALNSEKNETKVEEEKEIPVLDKSNTTHNKIKIHTERDENFDQKNKQNKKKIKWKVVKFCCCLSSGCI